MEVKHEHQPHSVKSDEELGFVVYAPKVQDRHRYILKYLCTNDQGKVCHLIGQYSKGHKDETFHPAQVFDPREIFIEVLILQGTDDDSDPNYLTIFADGHKPGCPMALPEIRLDKIYDYRDILGKTTLEAKAIVCKCDKKSQT